MNRRIVLKSLVAAGISAAYPRVYAQEKSVRITLPSPGSAGAVWRPLYEKLNLQQSSGVSVEWVTADPGKMQIQLTTGAIDVGVFGAVGLSALVNKGSDIVLFGPALNNHGRWLVRDGSPYRSPKDLVGKIIASTAETSETYQQAQLAANLTGLDLKRDFKIIFGSPTANLALFERGDVEGIITLEPTATKLVYRGAREIARVSDIWNKGTGQTYPPLLVGLAANRKWIGENRTTAKQIVNIFAKINGAIQQNPKLLVDIAPEVGFKPDEVDAARLLPLRLGDAYPTAWDEKAFASIDKQIDVAVQLGLLQKRPSQKIYLKV